MMQTSRGPLRDDFDMTKLQKSLMQQQRQSKRMRNTVAKLTPAEIRSLNNSIAASRASRNSSSSQSRKADATTPPLTPDHGAPARHSTSNRNSLSGPTPPQSPDAATPRRQNSASGNGMHIHSPIPQSHTKAGFVLASNTSRPASASSHRVTPTYRGPEVTKPGSFSMLQSSMLTHQIVDNPLSQFSRPRQSRGSGSPTREDRQDISSGHSDTRSLRSQSLPTVSTSSDRPVTPPRMTDSPDDTVQAQPMHLDAVQPVEPPLDRARTVAVDGPILQESHLKSSWRWRKSLNAAGSNSNEDSEALKSRRRSLSWGKSPNNGLQSVAYDDTRAGVAPEERGSLKGILPSDRTSIYAKNQEESLENSVSFDAHPAVRPLSAQSDGRPESKGKGREKEQEEDGSHDVFSDDSVPMYSRCSCCGKLRKPAGTRSLSPVFENENLRTNFTFEIERADNLSTGRRRSSSSASRQRHTAIIPMIMPEGQTVQAKIAPRSSELEPQPSNNIPLINGRGDLIAAGSEPIALGPKNLEAIDRKVVRFSSLYFPRQQQQQQQPQLVNNARKRERVTNGLYKPDIRHSMPANPSGQRFTPERSAVQQQDFETKAENSVQRSESRDQLPTTTLDKSATKTMIDLNGVETSSNGIHGSPKTQALVSDQTRRADNALTSPANPPERTAVEPGVALSTDTAMVHNKHQSISEKTKTRQVAVLSDAPVAEREGMTSSNVQGSDKVKGQSPRSRNFSYNSAHEPAPSKIAPPSFQTKPKSAVLHLLRANADASNARSPPATNETKDDENSRANGAVVSYDLTAETDSAAQSSEQSGADDRDDQNAHTDVHPVHRQVTYTPLPLPEFGNDFGEFSTTWSNYFLSSPQSHSNLVESVLAATNGDYDSNTHIAILGK